MKLPPGRYSTARAIYIAMYTFCFAPVVLALSFFFLPMERDGSPSYVSFGRSASKDETLGPVNTEHRLWMLEHELETQRREAATAESFRRMFYDAQIEHLRHELDRILLIANDNKALLRDGTPQRTSVLQRLVQLEEHQRAIEQWQAEQKSAADQNRQLYWALGISMIGHVVAAAWVVLTWWWKGQRKTAPASTGGQPSDPAC